VENPVESLATTLLSSLMDNNLTHFAPCDSSATEACDLRFDGSDHPSAGVTPDTLVFAV
jgi:hypothetical protein